jgi:hypothetical protein
LKGSKGEIFSAVSKSSAKIRISLSFSIADSLRALGRTSAKVIIYLSVYCEFNVSIVALFNFYDDRHSENNQFLQRDRYSQKINSCNAIAS